MPIVTGDRIEMDYDYYNKLVADRDNLRTVTRDLQKQLESSKSLTQGIKRYEKAYEAGLKRELALLLEIKELRKKVHLLGGGVDRAIVNTCSHSNLTVTRKGDTTRYKCNTCEDMWLAVKGKMWAS